MFKILNIRVSEMAEKLRTLVAFAKGLKLVLNNT